ncbi:MAG TPA: hypothetical protein VGW37_07745, partial [Terriglobia bacterium]|nr:hypothetical protein [Terriglobia bacterium]
HIAVPVSWDRKDVIFKNKPEKLLKTKGNATWIAKNEPENEAGHLVENTEQPKLRPMKMQPSIPFFGNS